MQLIITDDAQSMSKKAAEFVADEVRKNPEALLALSTGSTPIGCYKELVRMYNEGAVDFSRARSLNMDEYIRLDKEHPQGYYYFMKHHLYEHVNIDMNRTFGPDVMKENLDETAKEFDQRIEEEGGIDLILLGIGRDGHIAFNMPENELTFATHIQELSEATIQDNARFFDSIDEVPTKAMTIGIENIFKSKKVLLLANGEAKSDIMNAFLNSETLSTHIPATLLKLHPDLTVIMDQAAAQKCVK